MANASRPRRKINRRSLEYNEGLLHEEELAIRRALQASLAASKIKTNEIPNNDEDARSTVVTPYQNIINHKKEQHNNNHLSKHKEMKTKKKRLKERQDCDDGNKAVNTRVKKKPKLLKEDSVTSRSRSSSVNSSSTTDSFNSSSSNSKVLSKTVNSASSQTRIKCNKILSAKPHVKSPKKEKLAVKIRKKLLKKKLKTVQNGSDYESTVSGSTASEVVTSKKIRRTRKRKNSSSTVQKKFASVTPSPTKNSIPTAEIDTSNPLAKAEDFISFLCLRGHPQMPKDLDIFNSPRRSSFCEEDLPSSPPSSFLSELPSSPSPSLPPQNSVDSPSCETPTFDAPMMYDDGLHAMRMYAGIENRRKTVEDGKGEITVADLESEEDRHKNSKSVTPPLSFRVSPRPAPPFLKGTSGSKIIPTPAPLMTMSPSTSGLDLTDHYPDKPRVFYPTPDSPAFGPPPLMLSQGRSSGSGGCCSPPPLLYIPAAAQRVTHLHGPPKLERIGAAPSDGSVAANVKDSPPTLKRRSHLNIPFRKIHKKNKTGITNRCSKSKNNSVKHSRDQELNTEGHPHLERPSSADELSCIIERADKLQSSTEDLHRLETDCRYSRDTRSCPLHCASDLCRIEQAKKVLNAEFSKSCPCVSGIPVARTPRQGGHTDSVVFSSHVGYSSRNHDPCPMHSLKQSALDSSPTRKASIVDLSIMESPDSSISLGTNSLLENLQRAHDSVSSLLSPLVTCGNEITQTNSPRMSPSSGVNRKAGSPLNSLPSARFSPDPQSLSGNNRLSPSQQTLRSSFTSTESRSDSPIFTQSNISDKRSSQRTHDSYPSFIRDRPIYARTPPGPEPVIGQQTSTVIPFKSDSRDALAPPWSHLQPTYTQSTTPPRPYTLSIDSTMVTSYNHQQHIIPRTIPLLPANKVPIMPSNKHVSITTLPFNGLQGSLYVPGINQSYKLPSAFEATSPRKDNLVSEFNRKGLGKDKAVAPSNIGSTRGVGSASVIGTTEFNKDSFKLNTRTLTSVSVESNTNNSPFKAARGLSRTCAQSTAPNGETNSNNSSVGVADKVRDLKALDETERATDESTKKSHNFNSQLDKSGGNSEVKKRRGRPPGSKNKKTISDNAADKKNSEHALKIETLGAKEDSNGVKERNENNSKSPQKKKKIECPILRPTDEEFKDPIGYLKSVRSTLEKFGICIIDPPESWKLESHLPGNPRFTTKRQLIHRLQKRWGPTEIKIACIEKHLKQQQSTFNLSQMPVVGGCDLDLAEVSRIVMEHGGMQKVIDTKKWNKVTDLLKIPKSTQDRIGKVQDAYCKYLLSFDLLLESDKANVEKELKEEIEEKGDAEEYRDECYMKGRSFSMGCFQRTARNFQDHFFKADPSVNEVEREYWKIVQSRDKYVAIHHVKLDTKQHGSCFPTSKTDPYSKNGWNLNVLSHLKGSLLKQAGNVEDLTIPWLNIDMLFATKRWTTTPLQTYLLDYLHSSNDKVWYGVPESDIDKFPHTKDENTNNYEDGEFMVSPSNLSRETGLNVTRLEQKQGQFVVIAPKVFHCNISSGYSVSETVSLAFPDWILRAASLDSQGIFSNWPGFSYEMLLLKSINEVFNSGKENLECLHKELQRIRDKELSTRKELKELGVTDSQPSSTTAKGVQTIETDNGPVQVNATAMHCVMCQRLCHLSAVLSAEDSEILCLSDAVHFLRKEKSSESLSIVTNCSVSHLDEAILSVTKKLKQL